MNKNIEINKSSFFIIFLNTSNSDPIINKTKNKSPIIPISAPI